MVPGPKPLPVMTKIAPCAIGALNAILLAAFATLVMVGAAERPEITTGARRITRNSWETLQFKVIFENLMADYVKITL
jgi:hypothetical protein